MIHTGHQRPFDDTYRIGIMLQRLVQIFIQKIADTFHQRMLQTFFHRRTFTPGQMRYRSLSGCTFLFCLQPFGRFYQPFGRIRTTVEYYIFDTFQDVGRNIGIQYGRSRIDNPHIHSLTDGMIQKDCMHRLADIVVSTERERQVADSPAHMSSRQIPANPSGRFNEIHRIIVMLFDTRRYSQYIRVEDDILWTEIHHLSQNPVRPFADLYLPVKGISLPFFIESHHNDCRTVLLDQAGVFDELFFTFLQGDGVDNTFTLHTLQSGEDNLPFRRVNHYRNPGNIRLGSHQIQESSHFFGRIQQTVVHIHVDNLRSILHLLAGNGQRLIVFLFINQPQELTGTCHVTAFAYIHEVDGRTYLQQFQPRQPHIFRFRCRYMRLLAGYELLITGDVFLRRTTTSTDDIHQPFINIFLHFGSHLIGSLVVLSQTVRKSGIGISTDIIWCTMRQMFQERFQLFRSERAVQTDRENFGMLYRSQERVKCLSR